MKHFLSLVFVCAIFTTILAQSPNLFNYQAVVRNNSGTVIQNQPVALQISILQSSSTGNVVYKEEHSVTTNQFGLVNLVIGNGQNPVGNISTINWGADSYFIKIEIDVTGGTNYVAMGTNQLLSVPYALYAASGTPGPQGIQGIQGDQGIPGQNGLDGTGIANTFVQNDSLYFYLTNGDTINAGKVTGQQGLQGIQGIEGQQGLQGIQGNPGSDGINGQDGVGVVNTYVQNDSLYIYLTNGNTMNAGHVTGPQGLQGIQGLQGVQGQTGQNGINGIDGLGIVNTYIQNDSLFIYLTNGNTINAGHVTGLQGPQGIQGVQGIQGQQGIQGPAGTYTAGTGIDLTGGIITNTSPDQTITLLGTGATSVTGTYPDFTISSTDNNTTYQAGTGLSLNGTTFNSTWTTIGNNIYNNNPGLVGIGTTTPAASLDVVGSIHYDDGGSPVAGNVLTSDASGFISWQAPAIGSSSGTQNYLAKFTGSSSLGNSLFYENGNNIGLGTTTPSGRFMIQQDSAAADNEPIFEVKDKSGQTVMVIYKDSAHFFVNDPGGAKTANRGSFAVSGKSSAKSFTNNYLLISPDSTRIYTGDTIAGFGVENIGTGASTSYMHLTPNNYLIGHQAGDSISTGIYNSFFGFKCGISNSSGSYNVFSGFRSGFLNKIGNYNTFIGHETGYNNIGNDNTFIGYEAGEAHISGSGNVYMGSKAGQNAGNGSQNVFIGEYSGFNNNGGEKNVFIGYSAGKNNLTGNFNVFMGSDCGLANTSGGWNTMIGFQCGKANTTGSNNIFMGVMSGYFNVDGSQNIFLGNAAGFSNTSGSGNTVLGNNAGLFNTTGWSNVFIGETAGKKNTVGASNVFIGYESGFNNTTAGEGVYIGRGAGYSNQTGYACVYIGSSAGNHNVSGGYNLFVGSSSGSNSIGGYNVYLGDATNSNNVAGVHNVSIGYQSGINSTGSNNVFIGSESGYDETGSNKLIIENTSDIVTPLINGDFQTDRLAVNGLATTYPFQVGTNVTNGNGAFLTTGGVWTAGSSRSFKDRFVDIDGQDVLNKISDMELKGWFYKETQEYHIGPFAEDFYNAFGTGVLDVKEDLGRYLSATDVAGVSLIAVQELIKENQDQKNEINKLKAEIENIKAIIGTTLK